MVGAVAVDLGAARRHSAFFRADDVVNDAVSGAQLSDLLLHRLLEDALLVLDQAALLFVVFHTLLIAPVAAPPVAPCLCSGGPAVSPGVAALLTGCGALGAGA